MLQLSEQRIWIFYIEESDIKLFYFFFKKYNNSDLLQTQVVNIKIIGEYNSNKHFSWNCVTFTEKISHLILFICLIVLKLSERII